MRLIILLAALCALGACSEQLARDWASFKKRFNRTYATEEEHDARMKIFAKEAQKVAEHNARYEQGLETWKMGINKFSDKEEHELFFGAIKPEDPNEFMGEPHVSPRAMPPKEKNWVKEGVVSPVKDQGYCGSCWAFAATAAIESHMSLAVNGKYDPPFLSEQYFVDCDSNSYGCDGGWASKAFVRAIDHGLSFTMQYPYTGKDGTCKSEAYYCQHIAKVVGIRRIEQGNMQQLIEAIGLYGPVVITIESRLFRGYSEGLYTSHACVERSKYGHQMLAVGYGTDEKTGKDYWLVKNSWGTNWGENGYMRILRDYDLYKEENGHYCGFLDGAFYPVVKATPDDVVI